MPKRYVIDDTSWFIAHPYDKEKISVAVKRGGGKNIRLANNFGWSNQPQVVTFNADNPNTLGQIQQNVEDALGTPHIHIRGQWNKKGEAGRAVTSLDMVRPLPDVTKERQEWRKAYPEEARLDTALRRKSAQRVRRRTERESASNRGQGGYFRHRKEHRANARKARRR